jgi:hypothetical protein
MENYEQSMRMQHVIALAKKLENFKQPIDDSTIDDFRYTLGELKSELKNGISMDKIGLTQEKLDEYNKIVSHHADKIVDGWSKK